MAHRRSAGHRRQGALGGDRVQDLVYRLRENLDAIIEDLSGFMISSHDF
jgi:hypothetical protein